MNVLLVSHDAGGAEILSAWYRYNKKDFEVSCCLKGPALNIFRREHSHITMAPLERMSSFSAEDWVLTGSSLESDIERNAIKQAKEQGLRSVSFLDHWDLYSSRFERDNDGRFVLPDEIWVGDEFAYKMAVESGFDSTSIINKGNPYFEYIKEQLSRDRAQCDNGILYICETIGRKHEESFGVEHQFDDEFTIMNNFFDGLSQTDFKESVIIRLHPRENRNKYNPIIGKYQSMINIQISTGSSLIEDIQKAKVVVGMESMGLIVAILLEKKVFSYRTGKSWKLTLPFPEVICTDSVAEIASAVEE